MHSSMQRQSIFCGKFIVWHRYNEIGEALNAPLFKLTNYIIFFRNPFFRTFEAFCCVEERKFFLGIVKLNA